MKTEYRDKRKEREEERDTNLTELITMYLKQINDISD